jgi:hypothetical protein
VGPLTYSLCQKEVIGLAMWVTGMCAFPPLVEPTPVSLQVPGMVLRKEFKAPVEKSYLVALNFSFPSTDARLKDDLVGDRYSGKDCDANMQYDSIPPRERQGLGVPIPLRVIVRKQPEGTVISDEIFNSLCITSYSSNRKTRSVGRIKLKEGVYRLEVHNLLAQPAFKDIGVEIILVSGSAK